MKVIWDKRAEKDLYVWLEYMEDRNPAVGEKVFQMVLDAVETIAGMPLSGRVGAIYGTREKKVNGTPLRIIYGVNDDLIHILFIPHDRQKWPPETH